MNLAPEAEVAAPHVLGHVDWDQPAAVNERVVMRATGAGRTHVLRDQFVRIEDANDTHVQFLGRIVCGPFFPGSKSVSNGLRLADIPVLAEIEIQAELVGGRQLDTKNRPAPGSKVHALTTDEVRELIGCTGDMVLGTLSGREGLQVCLSSTSKSVL